MVLVKFISYGGRPIYINPEAVAVVVDTVVPIEQGGKKITEAKATKITLVGGSEYTIIARLNDVLAALVPESTATAEGERDG